MSVASETIDWFTDPANWSGDYGVPNRIVQHLGYTAVTVAIAAALAIPIGLWIGHTGRLRGLAVVFSGALRALPTLGVVTYLGLFTGVNLTATVVALVVLAVPPLLAGAYSGLESVERQTIDAARAMGMTEWQILTKVEVPLALPIIVGGLRSATLQVVATATVAAYVGPGGLGRFLIDGLAVRDTPQVIAGSLLVIALALLLDALFVAVQRVAIHGHPAVQPSRS
ncbi:ABC transporter permease [Aeromicrobium sp.]|uniref:ABC transporter permease n=1 Tax=Aeromicrobium sp. TaxID=1871063 RepID=UPI002FCA1E00